MVHLAKTVIKVITWRHERVKSGLEEMQKNSQGVGAQVYVKSIIKCIKNIGAKVCQPRATPEDIEMVGRRLLATITSITPIWKNIY